MTRQLTLRVRVGPPPSPLSAIRERAKRREELARDLLLKLVESNPQAREYNVRLAIEYTDELLAELENPK
jgi:hypothetical protein